MYKLIGSGKFGTILTCCQNLSESAEIGDLIAADIQTLPSRPTISDSFDIGFVSR